MKLTFVGVVVPRENVTQGWRLSDDCVEWLYEHAQDGWQWRSNPTPDEVEIRFDRDGSHVMAFKLRWG